MDIERIKYLIVSYLRVRLNKVVLRSVFDVDRKVPQIHPEARADRPPVVGRAAVHKRVLSSDSLFPSFDALSAQYFQSSLLEHFERPPYVTEDPQMNEISFSPLLLPS